MKPNKVAALQIVVMVVALMATAMLSVELYVTRIELDHARLRVASTAAERAQCGVALDWCRTTVKGSVDFMIGLLIQADISIQRDAQKSGGDDE